MVIGVKKCEKVIWTLASFGLDSLSAVLRFFGAASLFFPPDAFDYFSKKNKTKQKEKETQQKEKQPNIELEKKLKQ